MFSDGEVAQLARAIGSYPIGRGFDPPSRYHMKFRVLNTLFLFCAINLCHKLKKRNYARETYFPSLLEIKITSSWSMNIGTLTTKPLSRVASFIAVEVVFPLTPGSV